MQKVTIWKIAFKQMCIQKKKSSGDISLRKKKYFQKVHSILKPLYILEIANNIETSI